MSIDQKLVSAAIQFVEQRFPPDKEWAGAAAMYLADGRILISTAPDAFNPSVEICHETGAICEAFKLDERVVATVCVSRDRTGKFRILSPCGVCQERLMIWGPDVEAAVPDDNDPTKWLVKTLGELQPFYWRKQFTS
jgi:cytidine deaminase